MNASSIAALLFFASCGPKQDAAPPPAAQPPTSPAKTEPPAARPSLAGRAIDERGKPLAGAHLDAIPVPIVAGAKDERLSVQSAADADGVFAFENLTDGDWDVRCSWDGAESVLVATVRLPAVDRLDFVLPEGARVEGTLADADGRAPIRDTTVRLCSSRGVVAIARTDAEGRFSARTHRPSTVVKSAEFPLNEWRPVLAERPDEQFVVRDGERRDLPLATRRVVPLTGRVCGPDGPLARVSVRACFIGETGVRFADVRTDREGRYRVDFASEESAYVLPQAKGFVVAEPAAGNPFSPQGFDGPAECAQSTRPDAGPWVLDVAMKKQATCVLTGTATDADGKPVAGATVCASADPNDPSTRSAADGTFELKDAVVGADDVVHATAQLGRAVGETTGSVNEGRAEGVGLVLKAPMRLHGVVKRKSGAPAPGALVAAAEMTEHMELRLPRPAVVVSAGADGSFALDLPDAVHTFSVHAATPGATPSFVGKFAGGAATETTFDVVLDDEQTLVGRVVKKGTKEPVAGVYVAEMGGRDVGADEADPRVVGYVDARTDAEGRFKIPHAGDTCEIRVVGDGWLPFQKNGIDPAAGECLIELSPESTIEGRVAFADGAPVAGAEVWISHGSGETDCIRRPGDSAKATTDADGRFALRKIDAGPWTLGVRGDAAGVVAREVAGVAGGTRDLKIAVKRGTKIVGRVVGEDDKPIAHAHVYALADEPRPHPEVESGDDGAFALTCLDDGAYVVRVEAKDHLPSEQADVRGNGAATTVRLASGLAVEGRLVDPAGKPGKGVFVQLDPLPGENRKSGLSAQTDADGRFRFAGLVAGRHRFWISYAGTWKFDAPKDFLLDAGAKDVVVACAPK